MTLATMKSRQRHGMGPRSGSATLSPQTSQTSPSTGRSQVSHQRATTRRAPARAAASTQVEALAQRALDVAKVGRGEPPGDEEGEGRRVDRALDRVADLAGRRGLARLEVAHRAVQRRRWARAPRTRAAAWASAGSSVCTPLPEVAVVLRTGASPRKARRSPTDAVTAGRRSASSSSHLLSTTTAGQPAAAMRSASRWSWPVAPSVASSTRIATSARSRASRLRSTA